MAVQQQKLIIANCSGFFGDRFAAAREMVTGGPIDVLTGDYLAELTMAILFKLQRKSPEKGYVPTFLQQMETIMGECLDRGIRVVSNAGGLNPQGLADELARLAAKLGLHPRIAYIAGDNLLPRLSELQAQGEALVHMDKQIPLARSKGLAITANAYLGGWGIAAALARGADIVVTGRVADASLVTGPAAWKFGWQTDDWDKLAGAVTAGHIIECGAQATGGNYSFFEEVPQMQRIGFPIAEIYPDGSSVITKHPGSGGLVSVGTVTAQLMYEVASPRYLNPDVVARFDHLRLSQEGPDRVRVSSAAGEPPPPTLKVCINTVTGYKSAITVVLTGLDIDRKARVFEQALFDSLGGRERFAVAEVRLVPAGKPDPPSNEEAFSYLHLFVMDPDEKKVNLLPTRVVELALATFPGFTVTAPPEKAAPAIMHWPALIAAAKVPQTVHLDSEVIAIAPGICRTPSESAEPMAAAFAPLPGGPTVRLPLGRLFGARSGDKGGNANLGIWARTPEAFSFLWHFLSVAQLKQLLPETAPCAIERYVFANLQALNFVINGFLGEGVAASGKADPQAKTLAEYLRAKTVDLPRKLVSATGLE